MLGLGNSLTNMLVPAAAGGGSYTNEYSLEFDASNETVNFGNTCNLGTADFTIMCWVKTQDWTADFCFTKLPGGWDNYWYFGGYYDKLVFRQHINGATPADCIFNGTISLVEHQDEWVHIAISCNRGGVITGYVNGVADAGTNDNSGWRDANMVAASSRDFDNSSNFQCKGDGGAYSIVPSIMDECAVFNAALDTANIAAIYNEGTSIDMLVAQGDYDTVDDLVSYWKFSEGTGTSVEDLVGSNDGTLVNSPTWSTDTP